MSSPPGGASSSRAAAGAARFLRGGAAAFLGAAFLAGAFRLGATVAGGWGGSEREKWAAPERRAGPLNGRVPPLPSPPVQVKHRALQPPLQRSGSSVAGRRRGAARALSAATLLCTLPRSITPPPRPPPSARAPARRRRGHRRAAAAAACGRPAGSRPRARVRPPGPAVTPPRTGRRGRPPKMRAGQAKGGGEEGGKGARASEARLTPPLLRPSPRSSHQKHVPSMVPRVPRAPPFKQDAGQGAKPDALEENRVRARKAELGPRRPRRLGRGGEGARDDGEDKQGVRSHVKGGAFQVEGEEGGLEGEGAGEGGVRGAGGHGGWEAVGEEGDGGGQGKRAVHADVLKLGQVRNLQVSIPPRQRAERVVPQPQFAVDAEEAGRQHQHRLEREPRAAPRRGPPRARAVRGRRRGGRAGEGDACEPPGEGEKSEVKGLARPTHHPHHRHRPHPPHHSPSATKETPGMM